MKESFKFDPWQQAEDKSESGCLNIDVSEPPCKHCKFWRPRITTNRYGHQDGVVLCCNDEMHNDFSCFKELVIKNEIKS